MSKVIMLGTGNAMCTRCYNTCFYLETAQGSLMVDAGGGNGIFKQLFRAGIPFEKIRHLFVTHVHTDHVMGVIWLIRKISPMMYRGKYDGTFTIYCHDEVAHCIKEMCRLMIPAKICSAIGKTIIIKEVEDGETLKVEDMDVTFFSVGSDKTKQFGCRVVTPEGKSVVCHGDEPYHERNEQYVKSCDWFMCEAFCLYTDREQFRPYEKHHSTAIDAGATAEELGVKNLLLYHTEDTHLPTRRETYAAEAARSYSGHIVVPDDLETVEL